MAMHLDNDWVVPRLFREPFLEKPPLSLWLDAGAIRLFGGTVSSESSPTPRTLLQ